jgi:hypothetical protein
LVWQFGNSGINKKQIHNLEGGRGGRALYNWYRLKKIIPCGDESATLLGDK